MAEDLFHNRSPSKLREEIAHRVLLDKRSLPPRTKIFAAVAAMQGFDQWPALQAPADVEKLIANGHIELNRGLCGTRGVLAMFYAIELVKGPMYPGTLSAFGTGIHLATTSEPKDGDWNPIPAFPRVSKTACKYACGPEGTFEKGVLLRCALKSDARILDIEQVKEIRKENLNRAREAQLTDCGSLAAALGYDGFLCEKLDAEQEESWYVIVNRTALIFQNIVLQHGRKAEDKK